MSKAKKITPMKVIIVLLAVSFLAMYASSAIYYFVTPKVYAMSQQKGRLMGDVYDCVIPKDALTGDTVLYFASPEETVVGTRHRIFSRSVVILAEENGQVAVRCDGLSEDTLIVLAHDGEIEEYGDVIVLRS